MTPKTLIDSKEDGTNNLKQNIVFNLLLLSVAAALKGIRGSSQY